MSDLRLLSTGDYLAHRQLMSHAFGRGSVVDPPAEPKDPPRETIGFFEGEALLSALTICPFTVYWPGSREGRVPMGGIAGVATYAEHRGGGYVARLLTESLARMRDAGQVVSALYPFSWAFYRKYGWDAVGEKRKLVFPLRELPSGTRAARRLDGAAAREHVAAAYGAGASAYRGAFTTDSRNWDGPLDHSEKKTTFVYGVEGGYLLWRYEETGDIREYIATTVEAETALLTLLRDLGMQVRKGRVMLPADETVSVRFAHGELDIFVQPVFSARVVDLAGLVAELVTEAPDGSVVLALEDTFAPWNHGTWKLSAEAGVVSCQRTTEAPQVSLGIAAFSQAAWGMPSLLSLRRAGKVTVHDEAGFAQLAALFPPQTVMCWNGF